MKPGLPGEPLLGRPPQPGIYVKFEHGVADVKDEATIELLMNNKSFGKTIIAEDSKAPKTDPYAAKRKGQEPEHDIIELKYGHIGKNLNPKPKTAMTNEQKSIVIDLAKDLAKDMAKEMLLEMAAEHKSAKSEEAPKKVVDEVAPTEKAPVDATKPAAKKAPATKAKK